MDETKIMKGTTTVGITFNGGVVIAADKRATMGTFIASKEVEKVFQIDERTAMTIAGGVGDAQNLVRVMRAELDLYRFSNGHPMPVQAAATLLANILQGNKYFPYMVQLIVAGYDESAKLYDLDPFGGLMEERYTSTGSGSVVAYGMLDEHFKDNLSEEEAVKLAIKSVYAAMKRDNATGEGVDVIVINKSKTERLAPERVHALLK